MTWLLAVMLLCAIQCRSGAYGFSHQFRQKPRLRNFSALSSTSWNGGCLAIKNSPLRFGREHQGYFETLSNNPSPSFCYGYVPWRDTRSKLEVVQFALPIFHAVSTNMNSKPEANVSSADLKKEDNIVSMVSYGESAMRSFAKALLWRVVAAIVTLSSGIAFSKNLTTALSLVCSDFLSKAGCMFIGERLWSRVQWGQGKGGDSSQRRYTIYVACETLLVPPIKGSTGK